MKKILWLILPLLISIMSITNAQTPKAKTIFMLSPYGFMPLHNNTKDVSPPAVPMRKEKSGAALLSVPDETDVDIVNDDDYTEWENSVFISPKDNSITPVFKAINSNNQQFYPLPTGLTLGVIEPGVSYHGTTDAGSTWNAVGYTYLGANNNSSDPSVAIDLDGWEFVGFMSETINGYEQFVSRSTNGGSTFTQYRVDADMFTENDKNHLSVDNSVISTYKGQLYDVWTDLLTTNGIQFSRSTTHGVSWEAPFRISGTFLDPGSVSVYNQGANVQTAPNGHVYVCWAIYEDAPSLNETGIGFTKSTDGGANFSTPVKAFSILGHRATPLGGGKTMRHYSYPSMTVNQQNGDIYIVVTELVSTMDNSTDVFFYKSTDGGSTFSSRQRVNQVATNDQWSPWIACDEISGALTCIFYDTRGDEDVVNTYVAVSYDGGATWSDGIVSDNSWDAAHYIYNIDESGDYIGIDSRYCQCVPVWTGVTGSKLTSFTSPFKLDCPDNLTLCKATIHEEAMYSAHHTITVAGSSSCDYIISNNSTTDGGRCVMQAGDYIQINEGFHAEENSYYHALIGDCETFCDKKAEFYRSSQNPSHDSPLKQPLASNDSVKSVSNENSISATITLRTFPNPASDHFILQYEIPINTNNPTSIHIISALGIEVIQPLVYHLPTKGQYAEEIDASSWQSGAYTIIVQNEYSASTTKFLLVH